MVRHADRKFGKFVDWDLSIQFDRESPAGVRILRVMVCGSSDRRHRDKGVIVDSAEVTAVLKPDSAVVPLNHSGHL